METNNLMLENYVQLDGDVHQVVAISIGYIGLAGGSDKMLKKVDAGRVEPIALTEEWLGKFGSVCAGKKRDWFDIVKDDYYFALSVNVRTGAYALYLGSDWMTIRTKSKLKYVHQLQNLYLALTGEKLTRC